MIAASRSRPECNASERTPKLPVRITRKAFKDTSNTAEPTLNSAARRFSRTSSFCRAAITVTLDYLRCREFPYSAKSRCAQYPGTPPPRRWAARFPCSLAGTSPKITFREIKFAAHQYLPSELRQGIFALHWGSHPYERPPPDCGFVFFWDG